MSKYKLEFIVYFILYFIIKLMDQFGKHDENVEPENVPANEEDKEEKKEFPHQNVNLIRPMLKLIHK